MANLLAIDTATHACSCALLLDGDISERFEIIPRQHAGRLLPMIDELLGEHAVKPRDLDAIAYGQGPGSFTGLRIAAGVAQGMAFGAGLPAIGVSSLASLAMQLPGGNGVVFATLDAKIDEVYWGFYRVEDGTAVLVESEGLCRPEDLPGDVLPGKGALTGIGSGLDFLARMPGVYQERITLQLPDYHPRAGTIATLAAVYFERGKLQAPVDINPVYLRDKVTHAG